MKKLLLFISLLVCFSAFSQRKAWNPLSIINDFVNGVKANRLYLHPQATPLTSSDDTTSAVIWVNPTDTSAYLLYKGVNKKLSGGATTINNSNGALTQNTKDTTVTFSGDRTYADIPTGLNYTPVTIDITVDASVGSADDGQGFSSLFNSGTHVLRIIYPAAAPIGTFTYHIVFTKSS